MTEQDKKSPFTGHIHDWEREAPAPTAGSELADWLHGKWRNAMNMTPYVEHPELEATAARIASEGGLDLSKEDGVKTYFEAVKAALAEGDQAKSKDGMVEELHAQQIKDGWY